MDRCDLCGHGFLNPQPSFEELSQYYEEGYACYASIDDRAEALIAEARTTGELRHVRVNAGMKLLDYGCGSGDFLLAANKLGAHAVGIEPSELAARLAQEAGLPVVQGTIDTVELGQLPGPFDIITLNHVLEHVPDPSATMKSLGNLLASGGVLWIAVPNAGCYASRILKARWHSADLPRHLHHFTYPSLKACGEFAGMELQSLRTYTVPGSMTTSLHLILRYCCGVPRRISRVGGLVERFLAPTMSRLADARNQGEALIATFVKR